MFDVNSRGDNIHDLPESYHPDNRTISIVLLLVLIETPCACSLYIL